MVACLFNQQKIQFWAAVVKQALIIYTLKAVMV